MNRTVALIITLILCLVAFEAYYLLYSGSAESMVSRARFAMGTSIEIKVPVKGDAACDIARSAIEKAFAEISRIEDRLSVYKQASEVSKINGLKSGEKTVISDETFGLIELSALYGKKAGGVFDVTVKPLVDLWRKAAKANRLPSPEEVERARSLVGYDKLVLNRADRSIMFLKDGMGIDLGGVAKGYAADRAVSVLKENGVSDALVNCGGDMYCLGRHKSGKPWKVGVRHPRDGKRVLFEMYLEDKGVDTSGDYERYFTLDGKRYSHIIDPRSGYPAEGVMSATVIAGSSVIADIVATTLCVLGNNAMDAVSASGSEDAILVYDDNGAVKVSITKGAVERYGIQEKVI